MPYRNEDEVLRERYRTLEGELSLMKESRERLSGLDAREAKVREEMAALTRSIARSRPRRADETPLLANLTVASPCPAKWDDMVGDERTRFCSGCKKNVHNLSALDAAEAEALLREKNGELCVRYFQRADGTVMTQDCPDGVRRKKTRRLSVLAAGAFGLTASAYGALTAMASMGSPSRPEMMGDVAPPTTTEVPLMGAPMPVEEPSTQRVDPPAREKMGEPGPVPPAKPVLMGRVAVPAHHPAATNATK